MSGRLSVGFYLFVYVLLILSIAGVPVVAAIAWLSVAVVAVAVLVVIAHETFVTRVRARGASERLAGPPARDRLPFGPDSVLTGGKRRRRDLAVRSKGDR